MRPVGNARNHTRPNDLSEYQISGAGEGFPGRAEL
jgi:hypothetical protein